MYIRWKENVDRSSRSVALKSTSRYYRRIFSSVAAAVAARSIIICMSSWKSIAVVFAIFTAAWSTHHGHSVLLSSLASRESGLKNCN